MKSYFKKINDLIFYSKRNKNILIKLIILVVAFYF